VNSKPAERPTRKRRGLVGLLTLMLTNVILMSVFAWFVLLIGFGIYRIHHSREQTVSMMQAVIQPNVNLLKTNAFGKSVYQKLQQVLKKMPERSPGADIAWLNQKWQLTQEQMPNLHHPLQQFWQKVNHEILPLFWGITGIVLTRLGILLLTLPLFLLCLGLGLVDGLVQRDIRKFQGARESTLLFHEFKRGSGFWFFVPLLIYFLWPWPLEAQWVLLPLAIAMGLLMQLGAKSFKKYV
jgi:integrating conjugative element membrane protein (TIGR03747 family)